MPSSDFTLDHPVVISGRARESAAEGLAEVAASALGKLIVDWVVLPEEWDELPPAVQRELLAIGDTGRLLARLGELNLLTPFQAEAVRDGRTDHLVIGQYRVLDVIGRGGMGTVYRAEHLHLRKQVAVKVLERTAGDDARRLHRFLLEARAVAGLRHPHVVACLDAGREDRVGRPRDYYVMEFIPGVDLQRLVREQGPLPVRRACDLFRQVAEALGEAHRHGLVHRDIKPSNLLITPDWRAMVLDFGLALHPRRNVTEPGTVLGTVGYMAPEQATDPSRVDARADLFALGASLFWALAGHDPFPESGSVLADLIRRQTAAAPLIRTTRPEVPAELGDLIAKLMEPDPDRRPASMAAAAAALTPLGRWQPDSAAVGIPHRPAVLVIDDDAQIRTYIRTILGDEFAGEDAGDGPAGWAALGRQRFDLVVLDVDLPGMGGSELVARIRREGPDPRVKVLLMSGAISPECLGGLLRDEADDFIGKPFTAGEFRSRVRALLARGEGSDEGAGASAVAPAQVEPIHGADRLAAVVSRLLEEIGLARPGHSSRVRQYVRALAAAVAGDGEYARLKDPAYLEALTEVAPVYDLGLLTIPSYVLLKPGKLDPDELSIVRGHAASGSQVLLDVAAGSPAVGQGLGLAAEVTGSHHERWDGSGYPDGLAGPAIPLSARVVAVVSVYEALRSRRPHRPAYDHARAVRLIAAESAGQFDPALRAAFEAAAPQFDRIARGTL